jgi:DNA repair protein RadC
MQKHSQGHRARLRERLNKDPSALPDYEILELLLGHVLARGDTKPLAKELLARFQSLRGVLDAREDELLQVSGFGPALLGFRRLLRELLARYEAAPLLRREVLATPQAVARMARKRLAASSHEELWAAFLDTQNRLLAWERVAAGSLNMVPLQPRDLVARALTLKASGILLVHNHPGGSSRPSPADLNMTEQVRTAAGVLSIRMVDHLIVTDADCWSILHSDLLS